MKLDNETARTLHAAWCVLVCVQHLNKDLSAEEEEKISTIVKLIDEMIPQETDPDGLYSFLKDDLGNLVV